MTGNLRLNISMKYDPDQCCISGKWMRLHASFNYLFCKENYYTKNAIWHPMLYIRAYLTRFYQVQLRWEWGNRVIKNRRCWCNDFPGFYAFFSRLYPGVSSLPKRILWWKALWTVSGFFRLLNGFNRRDQHRIVAERFSLSAEPFCANRSLAAAMMAALTKYRVHFRHTISLAIIWCRIRVTLLTLRSLKRARTVK